MTTVKVLSFFICLLCYSCGNDLNQDNRNTKREGKIQDTIQISKRDIDIHAIDKLGRESKITDERKIDPELLALWNRFTSVAANKKYSELLHISLDTIEGCNTKFKTQEFIKTCLPHVFDTVILRRFLDISYSSYTEHEVISSYMPQFILKSMENVGNALTVSQFQVLKELTQDGGWTMTFDFIKTKNGYRFIGCDSYGGPDCCR